MAKETSREQDSKYTQPLQTELGMGSPHVWNVQHPGRKNASVRKGRLCKWPSVTSQDARKLHSWTDNF